MFLWKTFCILPYCSLALQDVTIEGSWVKGIGALSVLFLTAACESTFSQNKKFN